MLVRPWVSASDDGNDENRHGRPPQDAAQRRIRTARGRAMTDGQFPSQSGPDCGVERSRESPRRRRQSPPRRRHRRPRRRPLCGAGVRNGFLLSRKSSNDVPGLAAAEHQMPSHVFQRVQKRDACSVAASKLHRGSQCDSGGDEKSTGVRIRRGAESSRSVSSALAVRAGVSATARHLVDHASVSPEP